MKRTTSSWRSTIYKLGYRFRRVSKRRSAVMHGRKSYLESLERREMLTATPGTNPDALYTMTVASAAVLPASSNAGTSLFDTSGLATATGQIPNLNLHPLSNLPGDYNADGQVDGADYVAWRHATSAASSGAPAQGALTSDINGDGYDIWRQNYGSVGLQYFGYSTAAEGNFQTHVPYNDEFLANSASTSGFQYAPAVASLANGESVLVWSGAGTDSGGSVASGVWLQRIGSDGTPREVMRVDISSPNGAYNPMVSSDGNGQFVVVWHDAVTGTGAAKIYARTFQVTSGTISGGTTINVTSTADFTYYPSVAMQADGTFLVTWRGMTASNNFDVFARQYNANGTPKSSAVDIIPSSGFSTIGQPQYSDRQSVVADNGNYWLLWREVDLDTYSSDLLISKATLQGDGTLSWSTTPTVLKNISGRASGTIYDASIGRDGQGNLLVVWSQTLTNNPTKSTVMARRFNAAATSNPWGAEFEVAALDSLGILTNVAGDSAGRFAIAEYEVPSPNDPSYTPQSTHTGAFIQWYDPSKGTTDLQHLNQPVQLGSTNVNIGVLTSPGLAVGSNDRVVVAWTAVNSATTPTDSDVHARMFVVPPTSLTVDTTADEDDGNFSAGHLSLREALELARSYPGDDIIHFDTSVFAGVQKTISLDPSLGELLIDSNVDIDGPGSGLLTIDAGAHSRIFEVKSGVTASISGMTISHGGNVSLGGAIYDAGDLSLDDVELSYNAATVGGGAVYVVGTNTVSGQLQVDNSTVEQNSSVRGAGIFVAQGDVDSRSTLSINESRITGNTAAALGGGIYSYANSFSVNNSEISDNVAADEGGGIFSKRYSSESDFSVLNSTISGNKVTFNGGRGGGIYDYLTNTNYGTNAVQIADSTIAFNTATFGGGISINEGPVRPPVLRNTIVAENVATSSDPNAEANIQGDSVNTTASAFNLIGSSGSGGLVDGSHNNIVLSGGASAGLAPLDFYGGPTRTNALLPGSVAIDAGSDSLTPTGGPSVISTDQRGYDRFVDDPYTVNRGPSASTVDIGAFEYGSVPAAHVYFDANGVLYVNDHYEDADEIFIDTVNVGGVDIVRVNGDSTGIPAASVTGLRLSGFEGSDTIDLTRLDPSKFPQLVADQIFIFGGDGSDTVLGSPLADVIDGGEGDDQLYGFGGADLITGGAGSDLLDGGDGDDVLLGGLSPGQIGTDSGNFITGGAGNDWMQGGDGNDSYYPGYLVTDIGNDVISDSGGSNTLDFTNSLAVDVDLNGPIIAHNQDGALTPFSITLASGEIDTVHGSNYGDVIIGSPRDESIYGGQGDDVIDSGGGHDWIDGGDGIDTIHGFTEFGHLDPGTGFDNLESLDAVVGQGFLTATGTWGADPRSVSGSTFNGSELVSQVASGGTSTGYWSFANATTSQKYLALATWNADPTGGSSSVNYAAGGTQLTVPGVTSVVDQTKAPTGYQYAGLNWQSVAAVQATSSPVSLVLYSTSGKIYADAAMLIPLSVVPKILPVTPPTPISFGGDVSINLAGDFLDDTVPDSAKSKLQFRVASSSPDGVEIVPGASAGSATLTWKPSRALGTGTFNIVVELINTDEPDLVVTTVIPIVVSAANIAPVVDPIDHQYAPINRQVTFQVDATDDGPQQLLSYHLVGNYPMNASLDATTGVFRWTPAGTDLGEYAFDVAVEDQGNPQLTTTIPVLLTVYDPAHPTTTLETVPSSLQTVNEDGSPLVLSSANANAIHVAQSSAGANGLLELTLVATNGTLSFIPGSALSSLQSANAFKVGTGSGDRVITVRGTASALNAVLNSVGNGLVFTPTANYHGSASVRVRAVDLEADSYLESLSPGSTIAINVNSVDDPPTVPNYVFSVDNASSVSIYPLSDFGYQHIVVGTIVPTDPDSPDAAFTFSLPPDNPSVHNEFQDVFDIDPETGTLIRREILDPSDNHTRNTVAIDFGTNGYIDGEVIVTDKNNNHYTSSVRVYLNNAPTASDSPFIDVTEDTLFQRSSLFTDFGFTDTNSDSLSVASVNGTAFSFGEPIVLPSGAKLTIAANGSYSYDSTTYNATYSTDKSKNFKSGRDFADVRTTSYLGDLEDSFEISVSDGKGGSTSTTVQVYITPANDPPTIVVSTPNTDKFQPGTTPVAAIGKDQQTADVVSIYGVDPDLDADGIIDGNNDESTLTYSLDAVGTASEALLPYLVLDQRTSHVDLPYVDSSGHSYTSTRNRNFAVIQLNVQDNLAAYQSLAAGTYVFQITVTETDNSNTVIATTHQNISIQLLGTYSSAANDPRATDDQYTTWSDTPVAGNVLTADTGNGVDSDPNSQTLTVHAVNGDHDAVIQVGQTDRSLALPSGATLVIRSDGSFLYDPSQASQFQSLTPGEVAQDVVRYTITDGHGGYADAELTFNLQGVNHFPIAVDNAYSVLAGGSVEGNFITDNGVQGADRDPDGDPLVLTAITFNNVTYPVTAANTHISWTSGATLTVSPNGDFTYQPDPSATFDPISETASHTFEYTISDSNLGSTSTATAVMTINATKLSVSSAKLANDASYGADNDYITSDPTIVFNFAGDATGLTHIYLQIDLEVTSSETTSDTSYSEGVITLNVVSGAVAPYVYDPSSSSNWNSTPGVKAIHYRWSTTYPNLSDPLFQFDGYDGIQFQLVAAVNSGTLRFDDQDPSSASIVDPLKLSNDTSHTRNGSTPTGTQPPVSLPTDGSAPTNPPTIDPGDSTDPTQVSSDHDGNTRDPRVTGTVLGAIPSGDHVVVELTISVNGTLGGINPSSNNYDPYYTSWTPADVVVSRTIQDQTGIPPTYASRTFEVDPRKFTVDGEEVESFAVGQTPLITDDFSGSISVSTTLKLVNASGTVLSVVYTSASPFDYTVLPRPAATLDSATPVLLHDTGAHDDDRITSDPTITGVFEDVSNGDANELATRLVQFDITTYNDYPGDTPFDGILDGQALVNTDGTFDFRPTKYSLGASTLANLTAGKYFVRVYVSVWDTDTNEFAAPASIGDIDFELAADPPPDISSIALVNPSNNGTPVTTNDALIHGQVDIPQITHDTTTFQPPDTTAPDVGSVTDTQPGDLQDQESSLSSFPTFQDIQNAIGAASSPVEVELYVFDGHDETSQYGDLPFGSPDDWVSSTTPTKVLTVASDGSFSYRPTDLVPDDPNYPSQVVTVWARTRQINKLTPDDGAGHINYVYGEWVQQPLKFLYAAPPTAEVDSFGLVDTSVEPDSSGIYHTTNPLLTGQIQNPENVNPNLQIVGVEFYNAAIGATDSSITVAANAPQNSGDGFATLNSQGEFQYRPTISTTLPIGSPRKIFARVVAFDTGNQTYVRGPLTNLSIEIDPELADIRIASLTLPFVTNGGATPVTTTNPAISGTVENPNGGNVAFTRVVLYDNYSGADVLLGETLSDANGNFTYTPSGLSDQEVVNVKARAYEYLGQNLVAGPWSDSDSDTANDLTFRFLLGAPADGLQIQNLTLLDDSGTSQTDKATANPILTGIVLDTVTNSPVANATVRFDHGNNGSYDGLAFTDSEGRFYYQPVGLPYLPATTPPGSPANTTIRVSPRVWNTTTSAFEEGTATTISFDLLDPATNSSVANSAGKLVQFGLSTPASTTSDPTVTGQVVGDGDLSGIIVDFDFAGSSDPDQSVTADQYGRFTATLALTEAQSYATTGAGVTVRARTRKLDPSNGSYTTSAWTTTSSTPASLTFDYDVTDFPRPIIGTVTANTGSNPPIVSATISNYSDSHFQDVKVEFAYSADGPAFATVSAISGTATYSIADWVPGNYTVYARAVADTGDDTTPQTYSDPNAPKSTAFTLTASQIVIHDLALSSDTGAANDGSTSNPAISGHIVGPSGPALVGVVVEVNYNGVIFRTSVSSSAGSFSIDPTTATPVSGTWSTLSSGYTTISAHIYSVPSGSGSYSAQNRVTHLVFSADPDGNSAQGLVSALNAVDPFWKTSQTTIDLGSSTSQSGDDNRDAANAALQHDEDQRIAQQTYDLALVQAQQNYESDIASAQSTFATGVAGQTQYKLNDFVWPDAPDDNALVIPDDGDMPQPPDAPTYSGPEFDVDANSYYQSLQAQAQAIYGQQVSTADSTYYAALHAADTANEARIANYGQTYSDQLDTAYTRFEQMYYYDYNDPDAPDVEHLVISYYQLKGDIVKAWQQYNQALDAIYAAEAATLKGYNDQYSQGYDAIVDALAERRYEISQELGPGSTNADQDRVDADYFKADKDADEALEQITATWIRLTEAEYYATSNSVADALKTAETTEFAKRSDIFDLFTSFDRDVVDDAVGDWRALYDGLQNDFVGITDAQKTYEQNVAASNEIRDKAYADADLAHSLALNDAQYKVVSNATFGASGVGLAQNLAIAKKIATHQWASAVSDPANGGTSLTRWANYQSALADSQYNYDVAVSDAARTRENSIAQAKYGGANSEQYKIAEATKTQNDAYAAAEADQTSGLVDAFYDLRVDSQQQYYDRDIAVSSAWQQRWTEYANSSDIQSHDVDKAVYEDRLDSELVGNHWSKTDPRFTVIDQYLAGWARDVGHYSISSNASIRINVRRTSELQLAGIQLEYFTALSEANEKFRDAELQSDYEQRIANDDAERVALIGNTGEEGEGGLNGLYFTYESTVAQTLQDNADAHATAVFNYDVANAGATRDLQDATASAEYNYATSESQQSAKLSVADAGDKRDYENAEAAAYVTAVTSAMVTAPIQWRNYQIALAQIEAQRAALEGTAEVVHDTDLAKWNQDYDAQSAEADYTLTVAQDGAAYTLTYAQAEAARDLALASTQYVSGEDGGQYVVKSAAITDHDSRMTAATYGYEVTIAASFETQGEGQNHAINQLVRARYQADYDFTFAEIKADFTVGTEEGASNDSKEWYEEIQDASDAQSAAYHKAATAYDKAIADIGLKEAKVRISARAAWADETTQDHVRLIEALVSADQDQRASLTEALDQYADDIHAAEIANATTLIGATRVHDEALAYADAGFSIASASIDATLANTEDYIDGVVSQGDSAALGSYEVALYSTHATQMANDVAQFASSPYELALATYRASTAAADLAWAQIQAQARNAYQAQLAAANHSRALDVNAATVVQATADATDGAERAVDQAELDAQFSLAQAAADADLVLADQVAENQRMNNAAGLEPTVDVMTARITAASYGKRLEAYVSYAIAAATITAAIQAAADDEDRDEINRDYEALNRVQQSRDREVTGISLGLAESLIYPYADLNKSLHQSDVDYAKAVSDAKLAHATRVSAAEAIYDSQSRALDLQSATLSTLSDVAYQSALSAADLHQIAASGDAEVQYQATLRDASVALAGTRATAEATYHIAVDTADVNRLTGNDKLIAAVKRDWLVGLSTQYVAMRRQLAGADGQYQVDSAQMDASETFAKAEADEQLTLALAGYNATKTRGEAVAEALQGSITDTAELQLENDVAQADADHAVAYSKASYNESVGFDQAWSDYDGLFSEYQALINYRDELAYDLNGDNGAWPGPDSGMTEHEWYAQVGISDTVLARIDQLEVELTPSADDGVTPASQVDVNDPTTWWWPALTERENALTASGNELTRAIGDADHDWRAATADADLEYTDTVAAADRDHDKSLGGYEQTYAVDEAMAQAVHDEAYANSEAGSWIAQTHADNAERESEASAKADYLSADYAAQVEALETLDSAMNIPWSHFEYHKAVADAAAWASVKSDYLANQADISDARNGFESDRAAALLSKTETINNASTDFANTLSQQTINKINDAADAQYDYVTGLADATHDYRLAVAKAELDYTKTASQIDPYGDTADSDTSDAEDARNDAIDDAKDDFDGHYEDLTLTRREDLAQSNDDFAEAVGGAYTATADTIAAAGRSFVQLVAGDSSASITGLLPTSEAGIDDLNNAYADVEAAAFVTAYGNMQDNQSWDAWRDYTVAEATARKNDLVDGMANATKTYQEALVDGDDRYDLANAKSDEAQAIKQASDDVQADISQAALLLYQADTSSVDPIDQYPDPPEVPQDPVLNMEAVLGLFSGSEHEADPQDKVGPQFQSNYTYAFPWLPGDLGRQPFAYPPIAPITGVMETWAYSGNDTVTTQSDHFYDDYPPMFNPWGPTQLDDYTDVRILEDTGEIFPAMYKDTFDGWVSPSTGVGGYDTSNGSGYRYEYVPDDYFQLVAEGSEHPEVALLDIDFGSRFDTATTASVHDEGTAYLGQRENARYFKFTSDDGGSLSHLLSIYYDSPDYGNTFNEASMQDSWQRVVDEATHPLGAIDTAATVDKLRSMDDKSSVTIDETNGDILLAGDTFASGGGGASLGSGESLAMGAEAPTSASHHYSTKINDRIFTNIDLTSSAKGYWTGRNILDILEVNAPQLANFVAAQFRFQRTSAGTPDLHIREIGSSSEFVVDPSGTNYNTNAIVWFEIPDDYTDFQAAAWIMDAVGKRGPVATLWGQYLHTGASSPESEQPGKEISRALAEWKTQRSAEIWKEAAPQMKGVYEAYIGLAAVVPGGGAAYAVYQISEGQYFAAALEAIFMGPTEKLVDALGTVAIQVGDKVVAHIPFELIRRFKKLAPAEREGFLVAIRNTKTVQEGMDAVERLLGRTAKNIVFSGSTALKEGAVIDAAERLNVFQIVDDLDLAALATPSGRNQSGKIGEQIFKDILSEAGYDVVFSVQNASDNGVDVIVQLEGGQYAVFEVKTTVTGRLGQPKGDQTSMVKFITTRLRDASNQAEGYTGIDAQTAKNAGDVLRAFESSQSNVTGNIIQVDLKGKRIRVRNWPL